MENVNICNDHNVVNNNTGQNTEDWYTFSKVDSAAESKRKDFLQLMSIMGIILVVAIMILLQTSSTLQMYINSL